MLDSQLAGAKAAQTVASKAGLLVALMEIRSADCSVVQKAVHLAAMKERKLAWLQAAQMAGSWVAWLVAQKAHQKVARMAVQMGCSLDCSQVAEMAAWRVERLGPTLAAR